MLNKIMLAVLLLCSAGPLLAAELNDPTKPGFTPAPKVSATASLNATQKPKWILSGIQIKAQHRSAIINQQSYQVGQLVGSERIKRILSNQVIFSSGKTLSLFDDSFVSLSIKD